MKRSKGKRRGREKGSAESWAAKVEPYGCEVGVEKASVEALRYKGTDSFKRKWRGATNDGSSSPLANRKPNKVPRAGSPTLTLTSTTTINIQ